MERSISPECPPRLCHRCFLSGSKRSLSHSSSCCQLTCVTARKPNKAVKSVFTQKTLPAHCKILRYFATVRCWDGISGIVTQGAPLGFHHSVSVSSCWMLFHFGLFFYSFSSASFFFFMCQIPGLVCSESWCFAPGEHSALSRSLIQAFSVFMASWLDELQIRLDLKEESLCCSTSWGQTDDNISAFYFLVCLTLPQLFLRDSVCFLSLTILSWSLCVRRWRSSFLWTSLAAVLFTP